MIFERRHYSRNFNEPENFTLVSTSSSPNASWALLTAVAAPDAKDRRIETMNIVKSTKDQRRDADLRRDAMTGNAASSGDGPKTPEAAPTQDSPPPLPPLPPPPTYGVQSFFQKIWGNRIESRRGRGRGLLEARELMISV